MNDEEKSLVIASAIALDNIARIKGSVLDEIPTVTIDTQRASILVRVDEFIDRTSHFEIMFDIEGRGSIWRKTRWLHELPRIIDEVMTVKDVEES